MLFRFALTIRTCSLGSLKNAIFHIFIKISVTPKFKRFIILQLYHATSQKSPKGKANTTIHLFPLLFKYIGRGPSLEKKEKKNT